MSKESYSRLKINKLLEESNWVLIDTPEQKANVDTEPQVKYGNGDGAGFIDYLLFDKKGFPLVVIEAKKEERDPLVGKEQARTYALNIKARFIILVAVFYRDQQRGAGAYISRVQEKTKKHTRHAYAGKERIRGKRK